MRVKSKNRVLSFHQKRRIASRNIFASAIIIPALVLSLVIIPSHNAQGATLPFLEHWGTIGSKKTIDTNTQNNVAIDSQGNIYVPHQGLYIKKFDSAYNFISMWEAPFGNAGEIYALDVDSNDNIWAVDNAKHNVFKFSNTGALLLQIGNVAGTSGTANAQFKSPVDIAVGTDDSVYVTDTGNHRVQKFSNDGTFQWTTPGLVASTADGQFNTPDGIAVSSTEQIYVADTKNARIEILSGATGAFVSKFSYNSGGLYCSDLGSARDLTIDRTTDTVYVTQPGTIVCDRVYRFTAAGAIIDTFLSDRHYPGIVYHDGSIYTTNPSVNYANTSYSSIGKYNASTKALEATFGTGTENGDLRSGITAMAEDSSGNVYISDKNQRITKFDSNGNFISIVAQYGTTNPQDIRNVVDMEVDADDNLYVLDATKRTVQKYNPSGAYLISIGATGTADGQFNAAPTALAVTGDGVVFAAVASYINRYATDGTFLSKITTSNATTLSYVSHMVADSQNNVSVLWNLSGKWVTKYTSAGAYTSLITINDPGATTSSSDNFTSSNSLSIDSHDNIYVSNTTLDKIGILTSTGKIATSWALRDIMPLAPANPNELDIIKVYVSPFNDRMYMADRYSDWVDVMERTAYITPPTSPQNLTATPNGNNLEVDWDAPASDNNGPIRKYTIEYLPDDYGSWVYAGEVTDASTTNFTITNLVADSFQVRVTATNDAGDSTPGILSAPVDVVSRAQYIDRRTTPGSPDIYVSAAAVDPTNGEIYLFDDGTTGSVFVYDSDFNLVRSFAGWDEDPIRIGSARDIEFGPDGRVYIADYNAGSICIFEKDGTFVTSWGVEGTDPGQLYYPSDLTFDTDGTLLVTNEYSNLQRFTADGTYIEQVATDATQITSSVVDENGNLYVANYTDEGLDSIYKYGSDGALLTTFGVFGEGPGQFWDVYDLDITPAGELMFSDTWQGRTHFYSLDGTYLESIGYYSWHTDTPDYNYMATEEVYETAISPDGTLYLFDKPSTAHQSIITLQLEGGTGGPVVSKPSAPQDAGRTVTDNDVQLTWSPPSSNGGGSITGYTVRYKESASATWTTVNLGSSTLSTTLTDLPVGTYAITIAAKNSAGTGTAASLSATITAPPVDPEGPEDPDTGGGGSENPTNPTETPPKTNDPTTPPKQTQNTKPRQNGSTVAQTPEENTGSTPNQPTTPTTTQHIVVDSKPGSKTVTVRWTAPSGIDVKEYLIEYQPLGLSEWKRLKVVSGNLDSALVNLPAGEYTIRVSAIPRDSLANIVVLGTQQVTIDTSDQETPTEQSGQSLAWLWTILATIAGVLAIWLFILFVKKKKTHPNQ